jgi:hypothetical protein
VRIPVWLLYGFAMLVIVFGVHRIRIGFRSDEEDARAKQRRGLYAMARRTHVLIGVVYVLLGATLIVTALGWNPVGDLFGPAVTAPAKDKAPTHSGIPIDELPAAKK